MRLVHYPNSCPESAKGCVIALGNFDGVHHGHDAIFNKAQAKAKELGTKVAVMSFEPHPMDFFSKAPAPFRITPFRNKVARLANMGVDVFFFPRFNERFRQIEGKDFIQTILHEQLEAKHVVTGYDFVFGHHKSGNVSLLREMGKGLGFGVSTIEAQYSPAGELYSSTTVRAYIRQGNLSAANELLTQPWDIVGRVRHGKKLGRTINVPTANIALAHNMILPPFGVYTCKLTHEGKSYAAICNIGMRPTVGGTRPQLEAHIFNFNKNIYGQQVAVELEKFIRAEQAFETFDLLKEQIYKDLNTAKDIHGIS